MCLKVGKDYHSDTDPVDTHDFSFKVGRIVKFYMNTQPEINLNKIKRIIVYECDVITNQSDSFLAAMIMYYESNGKFFDMI